jgi:hypothetical protein
VQPQHELEPTKLVTNHEQGRRENRKVLKRLTGDVDVNAATIAGLAAGAVFVATMEIDTRVTGMAIDDLALLGRPFVRGPEHARLAGAPIHFGNSAALAIAYAAVAHDRLPGAPWLRGVLFALVEGTVLYPLAALEQHHPGIRKGEIDRYWSLRAYLQSIPRHITYGAVLGSLYDRLRSR